MEQTKVILVDDDTQLGNLLNMSLTEEGYLVHFQNSLTGIKSIIEEFNPSILVFDVEVGKEDSINHAGDILQAYPSLPILFISSHTDVEYVARGVRTGGVGYLRKPFEAEELIAYIERFARMEAQKVQFVQVGSYRLNMTTRELTQKDELIKQLSPNEFKCMLLLLENRNEIVTYQTLSEGVWNKKYAETEATMNNLISKLRKILENNRQISIQTLKNVGYRLIC